MKIIYHQIDLARKVGKNLCSNCFELSDLTEGSFECCSGGMILSPDNMELVLRFKIPRIDFKNLPKKLELAGKRIRKSIRDPESGIRQGTKKYEVYKLWKSGVDVKTIIRQSKCNPSSVRSWVGRFRLRYGDKIS